ncbi:hypothetical protein HPB48_019500 [Haemaphysalis longicornis]|uniref:Uncharacterized protein n=1 Tax=Haemaphysalis longicornis TaxID=44386 RepID=A0A9J6FC80_HAELO|nr:hypothetical protein HPB48_019500 [Haemaphysalis longicornis]
MEVLEAIEKWDRNLISTATTSKGETVETVRALLAKLCEKEAEEDDADKIKFLIRQLDLLSAKRCEDPTHWTSRCSPAYFLPLHLTLYRYIRSSADTILPHPATIQLI